MIKKLNNSNQGGFTQPLKRVVINYRAPSCSIKSSSRAGFTIIETLMTLLIFTTILVSITGIFMQVLKIEKTVFAVQSIQENALFILEMMAREIRVSQLCPATITTPCNPNTLTMINPANEDIIYSSSNGAVTRTVGGVTADISSSDVIFNKLNFLTRSLGADCQQSRVTIVAEIKNTIGIPVVVNLQTSVTSRDISIEAQNPFTPCP